MTPLERIGLTLAGQFADRRPAAPVLSLYGCRMIGSTPSSYYRDPELYLAGQKAVVGAFDPDIVFAPFALPLEVETLGVELVWTHDGPPNVRKPMQVPAGGSSELYQAQPESDASLSYLIESALLLAGEYAGERPVAAILTAPSDLPAIILGIDAWLDLLLFKQEIAQGYLQFAEEHFVAMATAYFKAGVAFIAVPVGFANPAILTDRQIRELTLPSLQRVFGRSPGPLVFHHGANKLDGVIKMFTGLPNVAGFAIDERDDSSAIRSEIGLGPLILAGPSGPKLNRRSVPVIKSYISRLLARRVEDPRLVVVTSEADIPWDTPMENIHAFMDAVREAGPS